MTEIDTWIKSARVSLDELEKEVERLRKENKKLRKIALTGRGE